MATNVPSLPEDDRPAPNLVPEHRSTCCDKPMRLISSSRSLGVPHHWVCPECGAQYGISRHPETGLAVPNHQPADE
jgi:hypothetical protein